MRLLFSLMLCFCFLIGFAQTSVSTFNPNPENMLIKYAQYNHWANEQFGKWLMKADEKQMSMEIESSFNTLRKTIIHIWNAEYLWLQVLKGQSTDAIPGNSFQGSGAELIAEWLKTSVEFANYVQSLNDAALAGTRESNNPDKPLFVADMIQHTLNHSTYHRGQLITMGRQAGLSEVPRTDFIFYARK
jgi:uncharacterized damage-inducible protein DinB